jgi:hypothetical protein
MPETRQVTEDQLLAELCEECGGQVALCEGDDRRGCIAQHLQRHPEITIVEPNPHILAASRCSECGNSLGPDGWCPVCQAQSR